jgi:hypothetical protein
MLAQFSFSGGQFKKSSFFKKDLTLIKILRILGMLKEFIIITSKFKLLL